MKNKVRYRRSKNGTAKELIALLFLIVNISFAQEGKWQGLNPYPADVYFYKIVPVTDNIIYAGGLSGTLIKSTDCGSSWKVMKFNDMVAIRAICFSDQLKGFIADDDYLYRTDDGGINWHKIRVDIDMSKLYLQDVAVFDNTIYLFITAMKGLIQDMISAKSSILKSTDYGNSWQTLDIEIKGELKCAYFSNSNTGFISTHETVSISEEQYYFYKTFDGGKTWQKIRIEKDAQCLYFRDEKTGFAGRLRTSDGGNTWTDVFKGCLENEELEAIEFYDSLIGSALSWNKIFETTNGGLSWTLKDPEDQSAGYRFTDVSYSKNGTQWIVGWESNIMWKKPGEANWEQLSRGTRKYLHDVCFIDKNEGWVTGSGGIILHTKDGGMRWDEQTNNINSRLKRVKFLNPLDGFILGDTLILNTTNGGLNWAVRNDIKLRYPFDIGFFDEQNGIMVGRSGSVFKTANAGMNWIVAAEKPFTYALGPMAIVNKSEAWIIYSQGLVHVTNKGESFQLCSMPELGPMKSIQFTDSTHGFIVNDFNQIFMTADGGWVWKELTRSEEIRRRGPIEKLHMLDNTTGYISWLNFYLSRIKIDETGTMVKLDDFGVNRIESFSFPDKEHGWAVGLSGCILKYTADNSSAASDEKGDYMNISSKPFNISGAYIKFILQSPQQVKVYLYNSIGQKISTIYSGWLNYGENRLSWKRNGLSSGIYFISIKCNEFTQTQKYMHIQ